MVFHAKAALFSGVLILIVGIVVFPVYNAVLPTVLRKVIPLRNESKVLTAFEHPMDTSDAWITFYVFDLINPEEVLVGAKPILVEKGPYVYSAGKVREDVVFGDNDTVSFRAPRTMVFNKQLSHGTENDTFTTLNVPLYTVMNMLRGHPLEAAAASVIIRFIKNTQLFRRFSVYQILWGYEDALLEDIAKLVKDLHLNIPIHIDGSWGFFYKKNNTDTGHFNVNTGVDELSTYMFIRSWNEMSRVPYWTTDSCNMINGTDGQVYHPLMDINEKLYIFVADLCRSIYLTCDGPVDHEGIPLHRYTPPSTLWMYTEDGHPENECFCAGGTCPHAGALNISSCQGGAPVFVSLPHFLDGKHYEQLVDGLRPNRSKHSTYIDVDLVTGVVMEGSKKVQLNVAMEPIRDIPQTKDLPSLLFPVIWLDQSAAINAAGIHQYKTSFLYVQNGIHGAGYALIALGTVLGVGSGVTLVVKAGNARVEKRRRQKEQAVDENSPLINDADSSAANI